MQSKAATVDDYLAELPADRRAAISAVRQTILNSLPDGYEEGMQYDMIGFYVPHSLYPAGYHCDPSQPLPFVNLASQKNYMSLYLGCVYSDPEFYKWFQNAWLATGCKLDMGKSCVRFRKLEDVPLDVVAQTISRVSPERFIAQYEAAVLQSGVRKSKAASVQKKVASEKPAKKKVAPKGRRDN